jgi:hypothetical protein
MTGNMQYGKALDSSLAEGYFESYEKNKATNQSLANQKAQLAISQQSADTAAAAQKSNAAYQMGSLANQNSSNDVYSKALKQNNILGWGSLAAQGLGAATKLYLGRDTTNTPETPQALTNDNTPRYTPISATEFAPIGMSNLDTYQFGGAESPTYQPSTSGNFYNSETQTLADTNYLEADFSKLFSFNF